MRYFGTLLFACSLVASSAAVQAKQAVAAPELLVEGETVALIINGEEATAARAVSATASAMSGESFSWGVSSPPSAMANGKASMSSFNVMKRATGPGSVSIGFDGQLSGACPVTYDAINPIKGIGIVVKKNPGGSSERHSFSGITVTRCDASGMTFTYAKAGWDVKINVKI